MAVVGVWIHGLLGLGKPADHETVGVGHEFLHQLVVDGVSALHCDPVSLVHVVAGGDVCVLLTQGCGVVRIGFQDHDGEPSVRATFDQSLESLSPQQTELFRLLSLDPGPDISTTANVILTEQSQVATENLLGQLASAHLIERGTVRGRWQMHDLLREYAHEQATAQCERSRPSTRRYDQAHTRLTDYYVRNAEAANTHLQLPGSTVVAPLFSDREQALAWLDAERENLIATAHAEGTTRAAIRLGFSLGRYLLHRHRLQDLVTIRSLALDACTARGDTGNEAGAWDRFVSRLHGVFACDGDRWWLRNEGKLPIQLPDATLLLRHSEVEMSWATHG